MIPYQNNPMNHEVQPPDEIKFFNKIKEEVEIVFDIGSREDIEYIKNSYDKSRQFHLFEPDPSFLRNCESKIEMLDFPTTDVENSIYLNPFGIGAEEGEMVYYPNTQSFVCRTYHANSVDVGIKFLIKTLDGYCSEKNIKNIDFLKIDIEGMEIDVLNGGKNIINNSTKIIQFEFASTMVDRNLNPDDYISWFDRNIFDLYLQKVAHQHPYSVNNHQLLTILDDDLYQIIKQNMLEGSGCNMVAIRKEYSEKLYTKCNSLN